MENVELGRLVIKQVETFPEQFDMNVWAWDRPSCGTTACLAGWTLLLAGWDIRKITRAGYQGRPVEEYVFIDPADDTHYFGEAIGNKAQELLGMSDEERQGEIGNAPSMTEDLFMELYEDDALGRFRSLLLGAE